ncbi:MAG TPA: PSP1 C-terminal domain-containing protein [Isosphaeraceae bacterium]|jgi:cell fate regulator YaaT (PSP1 superfamily)|nr:PSP1 C-terminal domain-containing protein [Isosphaeraceae bacterium]
MTYLVRYGLRRHIGRFEAEDEGLEPGRVVVVRSARGTELGDVLVREPATKAVATAATAPLLRPAGPDDLECARRAEADQPRRLAACEAALDGEDWPIVLIDVEPLLDDGRTVLHYLGPHRLDASALWRRLRDDAGLDVVLEPVGRDVPDPDPEPAPSGCGSCGSGSGCGSCGTGDSEGHGCGSCPLPALLAQRPASTA